MTQFIQLDTTTQCNLNCSFCYKSKCDYELSESMSIEDIENIFENNPDIEGVSLVNSGEFFVHPEWRSIFLFVLQKSYERKDLKVISLNTNGLLVNEESTDFIIDNIEKYNAEFRITFSLNAFYESTFLKLSGKDVLKTVVRNTEYFIKKAELSNRSDKKISVAVQSVVLEENFSQIKDFVIFWSEVYRFYGCDFDICEDTFFSEKNYFITLRRNITDNSRSIALFDEVVKDISNDFDIKISLDIETGQDYFRRSACKYLFEFPAISKDNITICCRDTFFEYSYKKIGDKSNLIEDYYKSSHIFGKFENIPLCRNCNGYQKMDTEDLAKFFSDNTIELYKRRLKNGVFFDLYQISGTYTDVIDVLERFNLKALTSEVKDNNVINYGNFTFNPKKELDMCVLWTRNLKCINGKIFSGCEKCRIEITDYNLFINKLKDNYIDIIPQRCITCDSKFSQDRLRDRFYTFGKEGFHSVLNEDEDNRVLIQTISEHIKNRAWILADELLKQRNSFILYQNFLGKIIENNLDCEEVFQIITDKPDFFIWTEYALYTEEFFENILIKKITEIRNIMTNGEKHKLLIKYAEDRIKDKMLKDRINELLNNEKQNNTNIWNKYIVRKFELCCNIDQLTDLYIEFEDYIDNTDIMGSFLYIFHNLSTRHGFSSKRFLKKYTQKISTDLKHHDFFNICGDFLKRKKTRPLFFAVFKEEIIKIFEESRFHSLWQIIKKHHEIFKEYNNELFERITNPDFSFYNTKYIHFLYAISTVYNKEQIYYKIYSYYMKTEDFSKAATTIKKIKHWQKHWDKENYQKTLEFLQKKTNITKYIINRIGNIINGKK